ncbi:MAG TPA: PHP domain-containing protein [Candidatus Dormibacteraeota bacterium]|nr:PHP domain-containing protein [Candidatus Dormibacteraeota bacterium]
MGADRAAGRLVLGPGLGAAEVHAHTLASDGMVSPEDLVAAAADAGISVLCVTDHDTMASGARAREAGLAVGVDVVFGQEVTTAMPSGTHVVGLFLERPVRMGMSMEDTVDAIHDQRGLAVLAHPFMPTYFASISERRARVLLERRTVDGIELRHTAVMTPRGRRRLDDFYGAHRERLGAALGAGDSHFGRHDLGRVVTVFPGASASEFRAAVEARTTSPRPGLSPTGPPLAMRLAQQRRSLLWLPRERRAGRVGAGLGPGAFTALGPAAVDADA